MFFIVIPSEELRFRANAQFTEHLLCASAKPSGAKESSHRPLPGSGRSCPPRGLGLSVWI